MSYDIQVWSVNRIDLKAALSEDSSWQCEDRFWVHRTKNWQIVISTPVKVLYEDLPDGADAELPGIQYLVGINLEPIGAPNTAYSKLMSIANKIGKESHGIVFDHQSGTFNTPRGTKRYIPQKRKELFSYVLLTWFFTDGPLHTDTGIRNLVNLIEQILPEALPRRYGLYEPPEFLYEEEGKDNFLEYLLEYRNESIMWYPNRPVITVHLYCPDEWGIIGKNFRVNYFNIGLESNALRQSGWLIALDRFWRKASQIIRPFFGDVRTIDNAVRMGSTYGHGMKTGFHPVYGPWWKGIPNSLGHASVIGSPYIELWPELREKAEIVDDLAFVSTNNWLSRKDVSRSLGGVPKGLAQRKDPKRIVKRSGKAKSMHIEWNEEYPDVWPF